MTRNSIARICLTWAVAFLLGGCGPDAPGAKKAGGVAATAPAGEEAAVPTAEKPTTGPVFGHAPSGFGAEAYRLVAQKDEIVAVLKNGLVVIAKRVPSPVVSVRGYALSRRRLRGQVARRGPLPPARTPGGRRHQRAPHRGGKPRPAPEDRQQLQRLHHRRHTAFFVNTTTDCMDPAVDLVTGWMLGAKITEAEYRREYEVVQRELEMGKGEPDRVFYYLTQFNRYRVSPERVPVIGYQEVIQGLTRDDVYTYYKLAYQPNNMVFAVTGNLDPEVMLAAVRKHVDDGPARPGVLARHRRRAAACIGPRTVVCHLPQARRRRSCNSASPASSSTRPTCTPWTCSPRCSAAAKARCWSKRSATTSNWSARIEVGDDTPSYVDGTFAVDMELAPDKIAAATDAVLKLIEKVKKRAIDEDRNWPAPRRR